MHFAIVGSIRDIETIAVGCLAKTMWQGSMEKAEGSCHRAPF
jgi:hypothetical protein